MIFFRMCLNNALETILAMCLVNLILVSLFHFSLDRLELVTILIAALPC